jgi:predicted RNA methylase
MVDEIKVGGSDTATPLNIAKRIRFVERAVALRGLKVLDAGCGAGEYVVALRAAGANA